MGIIYPQLSVRSKRGINDYFTESGEEETPITMTSDKPQFDEITEQLNNLFDDAGYYLSAELKAIIGHKSSNGVLEFKVEFTNGDV